MGLENLIFKFKALGKNYKPIIVYKIRTMHEGSEEYLEEDYSKGLNGFGKPNNDFRITSFGKFLRRYGIDEIPQIINILKGDMNLVGIRPRNQRIWECYLEEHMKHALKYKPGIFTPVYSRKNSQTHQELIESELKYLNEKDKKPLRTDIRYFFKVLYHILFKGVRSA